jgi:hypothetical protein
MAMTEDQALFDTPSELDIQLVKVGGEIPVIQIDNFFNRPDNIRQAALRLPYQAPPYPYPGKLAEVPEPNRSLSELKRKLLQLVNRAYLPRVPPITREGSRVSAFRQVHVDFAVVDVHPDELSQEQRLPHTDPVPVFGLVYLNQEERGGTLFFRQKGSPNQAFATGSGYVTSSTEDFELLGRIEPAYNRLVIYPGFIPHSGEISGDWISGPERFDRPRLTQRLVFLP